MDVVGSGEHPLGGTFALIDDVARVKGAEILLEKVEDLQQIMTYGVMSTPGVVLDGKVVHAGDIPARSKVESWF